MCQGRPLSLVKRHVYPTLLLALRCLHRWQEQGKMDALRAGGDAGPELGAAALKTQSNLNYAKAQARAFHSMMCQLSGWLAAPVSVQQQAHALYCAFND